MITISVDDAVNGFIVTIHDRNEHKPHREICEREIDAWEIVRNYALRRVKENVEYLLKSQTDVEI